MNTPSQAQVRRAIAEAQTIVVKVGSSSLTSQPFMNRSWPLGERGSRS